MTHMLAGIIQMKTHIIAIITHTLAMVIQMKTQMTAVMIQMIDEMIQRISSAYTDDNCDDKE